ncbi:MAG: ABC transporter ATP-binding protein [Clostridia bacterium]|nr:ABC transporter ATP-binding protein [Clostridia bacterium]
MSSKNLLKISNVTKRYGKQTALKDVSFNIQSGRIVGLLGPNGSGKTTLIKIINGLLADYTGDVRICSNNPGVKTKSVVSYLPDKMALPEWLKVEQTLHVYADFFEDFDCERANHLLESLKLPKNKRISELSKGMKEKLLLVLTMCRRAKLYILDEPIAGVDPASREVILSTILNNLAENSSILLSTHIISDVETIFDDVIFLKDGKINLLGQAESLRTEHKKSIDQLFREVYRC